MRVRKALVAVASAATVMAGMAIMAVTQPASAATLTEITNFGNNPTNLRMHLYVPDRVAAPRPPILVAVHYCTGSGPAFFSGTEFASLADQYGFIVIYPSATRSGSCFDVSSAATLRHNGGSDSLGIISMVNWVVANRNGDANRVYATGASSGGMMTNVLIGAYPDVFKAGASFMGVPFACFATTDGSMWNTQCANGQRIMTPQQWGDLVRNAFPGFTGARPRMQIFHGTNDTTLQYPNFGEQIKQWTNVHGLSQTPSFTDTPQPGWTRTRYGGTGVMAPVEAISLQGVGHNLPLGGQARMAIEFFGLNTTVPTSTTTSRPPTTTTTRPPTTTTSRPPTTTTSRPPTTTSTTPPGCRVTYTVNPWNTGLTANVTIANTGTATISGWALVFTLPSGQAITSGWNATYQPLSGAVTATNMSYNGTIPPGGSQSIGFNASHTGNTGRPASFTLNGTACQVA
jgi:poly(hydroxyalkanoate) depolymerase family esterase